MTQKSIELSYQDRIDRIAIAYIQCHYDTKSMSVSEFMDVFNKTCSEIISYMSTPKK